jgi:methionyl-tRNA formyltransferase
LIDLPRLGCVNVHSSLLPRLRGAAPINWAIVRGDARTGVSTMQIVKKLDAGDVLGVKETAIGDDEYAPELADRLAKMGAALLIETLEHLENGSITPEPQDDAASTYAPIMKREDGLVDWNLPAKEIYNRVRGFSPWPGVYTFFRGKRFQIHRALVALGDAAPATMVIEDATLKIGCGDGLLQALEVQLEGKRAMAAADFVNGYKPASGEKFDDQSG